MTPRERLLAAIEFTGPDRCPIHHYVFPGAIWRHGQRLLDLAERYPDDFGNENITANTHPPLQEDEHVSDVVEWQDGWGTVWRRLKGYTSGEVLRPAIPDWDAWRGYEFPAHPAESHYEDFAALIAPDAPPLASGLVVDTQFLGNGLQRLTGDMPVIDGQPCLHRQGNSHGSTSGVLRGYR